MKIEQVNLPYQSNETAKIDDQYDLDVCILERSDHPEEEQNNSVTSKALCTPGCGKPGTKTSFCC